MNEFYGHNTKNLTQILEELTLYCKLNAHEDFTLKLVLPDTVIDRYSLSFKPIEKIVFATEVQKDNTVKTLNTSTGTVNLVKKSEEDNNLNILNTRITNLENAARKLRAAQKNYMSNRGNQELGKMVAVAAKELDQVLGDA